MLRTYKEGDIGLSYLNNDAIVLIGSLANYVSNFIDNDRPDRYARTAALYKIDLRIFLDSIGRAIEKGEDFNYDINSEVVTKTVKALEKWVSVYDRDLETKTTLDNFRKRVYESSAAVNRLFKLADILNSHLRGRVSYISRKRDLSTRSVIFEVETPRGNIIRLTDGYDTFEDGSIVIKLSKSTYKHIKNNKTAYCVNIEDFNDDIEKIVKHIFKEPNSGLQDADTTKSAISEDKSLELLKNKKGKSVSNIYISNDKIGMKFVDSAVDDNIRGLAILCINYLSSEANLSDPFVVKYLKETGLNIFVYLKINKGKRAILKEETGECCVKALELLSERFGIEEYKDARSLLGKDKIKIQDLVDFAHELAVATTKVRFKMRISNSSNSVYLILDNRNLRGVRISDHVDEKKKFAYNIILGTEKYNEEEEFIDEKSYRMFCLPSREHWASVIATMSDQIYKERDAKIVKAGNVSNYNKASYNNEKAIDGLGYKNIKLKEKDGIWKVVS